MNTGPCCIFVCGGGAGEWQGQCNICYGPSTCPFCSQRSSTHLCVWLTTSATLHQSSFHSPAQARTDRDSMPLGVALSQWWIGTGGYTCFAPCGLTLHWHPAFPSRFQPRWLIVNCLCIIHLSLACFASLSHPLSYQYFLESLPQKWFSVKISGSGLVPGETLQCIQSVTNSGKEAMSTNLGLKKRK